ncbi:MAG: magnesium transporter [Acidimicrobiia bacterium]|nr:magnesium transporter [Acidimicrobiia bacterium]
MAGLALGAINETLAELPGLLARSRPPSCCAARLFGALGARLGTAIHTGTFRVSARSDTIVGQNLLAGGVLTLVSSVGLAFLAKGVAVGFGLEGTISVADFVVISLVGGLLSSAVVMVMTVLIAANSVRFGWDLDNVMAPVVTAAGDMVTLPALFVGTLLVALPVTTPAITIVGVVGSVVALVLSFRSKLEVARRILVESLPIILLASLLSLVAGITLEGRLAALTERPALLALVPAFLSSAGAIGGILSSRLTSKLHLGCHRPGRTADAGSARRHPAQLRHRGTRLRPRIAGRRRRGHRGRPRQSRRARHAADRRRRWAARDDLRRARRLLRRHRLVPTRPGSRQRRHPHGDLVDRPLRQHLLHHGRRRVRHARRRWLRSRDVAVPRPVRPTRSTLEQHHRWMIDPETSRPCSRRPRTPPRPWSTSRTRPCTSATSRWPRRSASSRSA